MATAPETTTEETTAPEGTETPTEETQPTEGQVTTEEQEATEGQETPEATEEPTEEAKEESALWAGVPDEHPLRSEVPNLRAEAAARRAEVRRLQETADQLREQLASATSPEDFQAAVDRYTGEVAEAKLEATRERIGRKFNLPDDLVTRLRGETEEELAADAEGLSALVKPTPTPAPKVAPSGGLTPREEAFDARQLALGIRTSQANGVHF